MRDTSILSCAAIILFIAGVLSSEAKTERCVYPQQGRSVRKELTLSSTPSEPTCTQRRDKKDETGSCITADKEATKSKEVLPKAQSHTLRKRDEVSDYEGWEQKKK